MIRGDAAAGFGGAADGEIDDQPAIQAQSRASRPQEASVVLVRMLCGFGCAPMFLGGVVVMGRVGVDYRGGEFWDCVNQVVFGVVGDAVCVGQAQRGVNVEFGVGVQAMTDPAHPHAVHRPHPGSGGQDGFGRVNESRVDAIDKAAKHVAHGRAQHGRLPR